MKGLFDLGDGRAAGLGRGVGWGMCRSLETFGSAADTAQFSAMPTDGIQQLVFRTC